MFMKAFQLTYSEGDPVTIVAKDFGEALDLFVDYIVTEWHDDEQKMDPELARHWVDSIVCLGDEVIAHIETSGIDELDGKISVRL